MKIEVVWTETLSDLGCCHFVLSVIALLNEMYSNQRIVELPNILL